MILEKYSIGIGDRFGRQGAAQLDALLQAQAAGVMITPVWNKSNREHQIIGTTPADTRRAADQAVRARDWGGAYFVDADHIGLKNVGAFLDACDFFTLDVAESIGQPPDPADLAAFKKAQRRLVGRLTIPGLDTDMDVTAAKLEQVGHTYLVAVKEAARLYRYIAAAKGTSAFVAEVSMDECDTPQSPLELLLILAALAAEHVPVQTLAPKFTGRFNKGVDYVGDVEQFAREFEMDLAVVRYAREHLGLPASLKLSVHSGSDKFALYAPMHRALKRFDAGLHLKTAGTTWLEELIGLASAGGEGLVLAGDIYEQALVRFDELCQPYSTVIDIDRRRLPVIDEVRGWNGERFAATLRHDERCPYYNPHFRQLLHVGYKIAAEMGERYLGELARFERVIARNVTENLWERHIRPVFLDA
ncbi:MAG: tagaturonate epimerase family protein [Kiritimatiellota bacterium]|nr:tagaturonate epimerase family protein [Kiritimatiellota bacterium]